MAHRELLSRHEAAALRAVQAGALHRLSAVLADCQSGGEGRLYEALRCCEGRGLVWSRREERGRRYVLTAAGRSRLRQQRRFERALLSLLARSS
jgi:hypothetical protein